MASPLIPPELDPQDPLPDASMVWRRAMAFLIVAAVLWWCYRYGRFLPPADLLTAMRYQLLFAALVLLLYMGGATTNDLAGLLATLKLRLRGPRPQPPVDPTPSPAQEDAAATPELDPTRQ